MTPPALAARRWRGVAFATWALGASALACRPGPVVVSSVPSSGAAPASRDGLPGGSSNTGAGWRIDAREHVDLWLHGFAMLSSDSSLVPSHRLGYRSELSAARRGASAVTMLDGNATVLGRRLRENPALTSAQFVALYFASWDDLRRGCQQFLRANGNVRSANSEETLRMFATLATYFPSSADRDWLRLYVESLDDERARFFRGWWGQQQATRAVVRRALEAQWRSRYAAAFGRFMRGTNQRQGSILLALAIGGEGRSLDAGQRDNFLTVTFPLPGDDPLQALYVVAHEVVGTMSNAVVRDNTTPRDQQSGEAGRLSTLAAVRGGAMMLARVAPELVDGYQRYYLSIARQVSPAEAVRRFEAVFALPETLRASLDRQIDLVLNGI